MTKEERKQNFLQKSIIVHNNKYDYSKVNYVNSTTKICIICPEHGEYQQPRDQYIQDFCKKYGIQLLTIPYKYSDYESVSNYIKEYVNYLSIK